MTDISFNPRTGQARVDVAHTEPGDVARIAHRAAVATTESTKTSPRERERWLEAVAAALESELVAAELISLADQETGLGETRLTGELARMASQLRFYGTVGTEGGWLGATIDHTPTGVLAKAATALGPVAVFGASNFPFAFGVLGNDTASALAAGCAVVVKTHPAHPELSQRLVAVARTALDEAGAPQNLLQAVTGFEAGLALVDAPALAAIGFTGSQNGGMALWRRANERPIVIPVYAEMGTVNPVVVTPTGAANADAIARGFIDSMTLGSGQFCTKPGLLLVPSGSHVAQRAAEIVATMPAPHPMLTQAIAATARDGADRLIAAGGRLLASSAAAPAGWSAPVQLVSVDLADLQPGSPLTQECFGAVGLIAEYDDLREVEPALDRLQNSLVSTIIGRDDDPAVPALVALLSQKSGRVTVDQWPTGVAWTWAQHHGGPWPATSAPSSTSVGASALGRWTRPVAHQNVPDAALPPALQEDNPWRLPRRVDGEMVQP